MTDRLEFKGQERRGRAVNNAEEIRKKKEEVIEKLAKYKADEGVGVSVASTFVLVVVCGIIAVIGMFSKNDGLFLAGILGGIVIAIIGIWLTGVAKKEALRKFKKENLHLVKYLPS